MNVLVCEILSKLYIEVIFEEISASLVVSGYQNIASLQLRQYFKVMKIGKGSGSCDERRSNPFEALNLRRHYRLKSGGTTYN